MSKSRSKVHGSAVAENKSNKATTKPSTKAVLDVGQHAHLQWHELHAFEERNSRVGNDSWKDVFSDLEAQVTPLKTEGKPSTDDERGTTADGLIAPLLGGWDSVQGSLEVTIPTAKEISLAVEQRKARLDQWRSSSKEVMHRVADFVQSFWFPNGLNGEPGEIRAIVNMGYRRMRAIPAVVFARYVRNIGSPGDYVVPVDVRMYANELDSYMRHIRENLGKDVGRSVYTDLDYAKIARDIASRGGTESELRKLAKVGKAQKAFGLVHLDGRFPDLHLFARVMASAEPIPVDNVTKEPYYFPAGSDPADCPKINGLPVTPDVAERGSAIDYKWLDKEALRAVANGKQYDAATKVADWKEGAVVDSEFVEGFVSFTTQGSRPQQGWNAKDTKAMVQGSAFSFFQLLGTYMNAGNRVEAKRLIDTYGKAIESCVAKEGFVLKEYQKSHPVNA